MTFECAGGGKLSELVTDHILSNINGNKLIAVVNCDGVADEVRRDHTCA